MAMHGNLKVWYSVILDRLINTLVADLYLSSVNFSRMYENISSKNPATYSSTQSFATYKYTYNYHPFSICNKFIMFK